MAIRGTRHRSRKATNNKRLTWRRHQRNQNIVFEKIAAINTNEVGKGGKGNEKV